MYGELRLRKLSVALLLGVLAACSSSDDTPKLQGKRIAVLADYSQIKADDSLNNVTVNVPDAERNKDWSQAAGGQQGMTGNLAIEGFDHHDRKSIGDGNTWEQPLYTAPVVGNGVVYAMDSKGYITAHDAADISDVKWKSESAVEKDEPDVLGGGLAYDSGHLFVTTGRGKVFALNAADGKVVWQQAIDIPLRAAPKVAQGKVYVLSVDNQMFALDAATGKQIWNQRGMNENAGFLASISPAVSDTMVVVPYSSGEIHALDTQSGQDLWNDSLLRPHRTSATSIFSGIGGDPVIKDGIVYAAGSDGFAAAFDLQNGRVGWQQDISSLNTLWVAGDFIYMISNNQEIACLYRADGRVKWVKQLQRYGNEDSHTDPYFWQGPVMVGGRLLVADTHGEMLALSPKDGSTLETIDIASGITSEPVVAGGRLYYVTKNAKLHVMW